MRTIVTGAPHPARMREESKSKIQEIPKAEGKIAALESDIEAAERYFKTLREIEFVTIWGSLQSTKF